MDERIKELLEYFQEYLLDTDESSAGLLGTAKATYPMVVINMGQEAGKDAALALKRQLLKMWPPYKESLLFLNVEGNAENPVFSKLDAGAPLAVGDVADEISELFEESNYFKNYTRLLVFYLLDTASISGNVDLDHYLDLMKACGDIISFSGQNSVLLMTLNEKIGNEAQASQIRCDFANSYFRTGKARNIAGCTYLVSNKSTVGSFMPKQKPYYDEIFSDIIMLANGPDVYVASGMIRPGIKTTGYTRRAKPVDDIAKTSVSALLKKISDLHLNVNSQENKASLGDDATLLKRLGIGENGTFYMLDPYLKAAEKYFPDSEVVDAFPRRTCQDLDLYTLSAKAVEEETFGAWSCYMESIIEKVEQEIVSGFQMEGSFQDVYTKYLLNEFSRSELVWMSKNPEEIRALLDQERYTVISKNVIDSLKEELAIGVFENAGIKDAIINTIVTAGKQARDFMTQWNEMVNTESVIVKQQDIITFYNQKVQNYIDNNRSRIEKEFQTVSGMDELKEWLRSEIRNLIKSDDIFRAPFEEELIKHLNHKDPAIALRAIASDLSGENVKVWFASNGASLDHPIQMALLLQDTTELYKALHETLPGSEYYYYDTDINEFADALNIYELNEIQMMI